MDVSKLPRLSKTDGSEDPSSTNAGAAESRPPLVTNAAGTEHRQVIAPAPGLGMDIWFNTIVGLLLVFMGWTFARYLGDRMIGLLFVTNVFYDGGFGPPVPYTELDGKPILTDAGMFLFGVAVLLEAAIKAVIGIGFRVPRVVYGFALLMVVLCTLFNLYACVELMKMGLIPILSGLAVAFAGYIVADLLRLYRIQHSLSVR